MNVLQGEQGTANNCSYRYKKLFMVVKAGINVNESAVSKEHYWCYAYAYASPNAKLVC